MWENNNESSTTTDKSQPLEEPTVCRIFSDTSTVPTTSASFFDFIGNDSSTVVSTPQVESTEANRRKDAWILTEKTRQALVLNATSPPGTYCPEPEMLTMPQVALQEDLEDSIQEAVNVSLGEAEGAQRRTIKAEDVTQDECGLRELVQGGALRSAINLTERLLNIYGQGRNMNIKSTSFKHTPHSLQIWFTRLSLLVKTRLFQVLKTEAEPFGNLDKPDMFYQFYPEMYERRQGSMASFSFRLLIAEIPMHCGQSRKAFQQLLSLQYTIRQMLKNLENGLCEDGSPIEIKSSDREESIKLWKKRETRVKHSLVNCAVMCKDYDLAIQVLTELADDEQTAANSRADLYSALGRLHLQLGDVTEAETYFQQSRALRPQSNVPSVRDFVDRGLVAVAQNSFADAYVFFQQANALEPTNVMILNNMGVCLLYGGRLKEAIAILESGVSCNPMQGLHEALLLNLCTLYDMESSRTHTKKLNLLKQIARYQADAPLALLEKLYG